MSDDDDDVRPRGKWPWWVEDWVLPYLEDSILWPVAFALLAHVLIVIVPLEVAWLRVQSAVALVLLAWLLVMTGFVARMEWRARDGRFGALTLSLVLIWLASPPLAWLTFTTGIF